MIRAIHAFPAGLDLAAITAAQASTPAARPGIGTLFLLLGAGIAIVVVATLAVMAVRRRILARDQGLAGQNRLLDDLRSMRDRGDISPEEFDRARHTLAARLAGGPTPAAAQPPRPPRPAPPAPAGAVVAPPGFDLTGAPLPVPAPEPPDGSTGGEAPPGPSQSPTS